MKPSAEMTCHELAERVTAYLEGALPSQERGRFEAHHQGCSGCQTHVSQVRLVVSALGQLQPSAGEDLSAEPEPSVSPESPTPGHWAQPPLDPSSSPERSLLTKELRERLETVIDALPSNLRIVLWLRDVEGWSSDEVCNALAIQETNQRVLLHRARSRARAALEPYFEGARVVTRQR